MHADDLRDALARLAAGVSVVAVRDGDGFRGATVTSLAPVSLEPPLVLVCLDRLGRARDLLVESGIFTISVLNREQEFLAERFAGRAPLADPGWRDVPHVSAPGGLPVVAGALAWLECSVFAVHQAGDHDIVVGEVAAAGVGRGDPLVLWDRQFWTID